MKSRYWIPSVVFFSILLVAAAASATTITLTGSPSDWGIAAPGQGLNTNGTNGEAYNNAVTGVVSGISYWEEAGSGPHGEVTPGYGGGPFDIRGLYFTSDATNHYFAAIVGMGPDGYDTGTTHYVMGDILIGGNPVYQYGIVTNSNAGNGGLGAGTAGILSATANRNVPGYDASNPVFVGGFSDSESIPFYYVNLSTDLWFIEASVSRSLFASGITGIHFTESCGNDAADLQPVPEPGTMLLLGSGLVGLAGFGRKKFGK